MAENEETQEEPKKKRALRPVLFGLAGALALGAGGFYASYTGLIPGRSPSKPAAAAQDVAFVPIQPMVISLGGESRSRHLRFAAEMEVARADGPEVARLMPRVLDVLNGYLRAVDPSDFEEPSSLIRIRAQMLRRVQLVIGEDRVRDLLVTEFVLN